MRTTTRLLGQIGLAGMIGVLLGGCASAERRGEATTPSAGSEHRTAPDAVAEPGRTAPASGKAAEAPAKPASAAPKPAAQAAAPTAQPTPPTAQATAPTPQAAEAGKTEAASQPGQSAEEKAKKERKEARDRERKLAKLQQDLDVARLRQGKLKLDHEIAQAKYDESLGRTKIDLEIVTKKFKDFKEITLPNRIARAELGMAWAEDGYKEAQQELQQLELMYSDEQFADKTKEIVIDRARRRLERSQRDLELRRDEHKTLLEISIPLETREQELGLQDKQRALAQMIRDQDSTKIERQIGVIGAQTEITRLEQELADLQEEIKDAAEKKAEAPAAGATKGSP